MAEEQVIGAEVPAAENPPVEPATAPVSTTEVPVVPSTTSETQASASAVPKVALKVGPKNNICAYLDDSSRNGLKFKGMIEFLKRSRIFKAISTECTPYHSHVTAFWENAKVVRADRKVQIVSDVFGVKVLVNQDVIREVVGFADSTDQPTMLNKYLVRGLFLRVKYSGRIEKGVLTKSDLGTQYKYLSHVLQHCLSPRRAGHDEMRESIQSAFAALVLNIPFNFSGMVMQHMIENLEVKREKYLMYARFIQMILNVKAPELPKDDDDIIHLEVMKDITMGRLLVYKGKEVKPIEKRLIGHLAKADYVCPGGKKWRHDNSESETEDIVVPQDSDDDKVGDMNAPSSPTGFSLVGESSSQTLINEEEIGEEAPLARKRKDPPPVRSMGDVLKEQRKAKRFKLVRRSATTTGVSTSSVPPPASTQAQMQIPITPVITPATTTTATSSSLTVSPEAAQIASLNAMMLQFLTRQTAQEEEIKRLNAVVVQNEKERAELAEIVQSQKQTLDSQQLLIEATASENKQLVVFTRDQAKQLKRLTQDYTQMQNNMIIGEDGTLRLKGPDDASADPSGGIQDDDESTDSDSDDNETPATGIQDNPVDIAPLSKKLTMLTHILDMQGVIQYSVEYDPEEGEIVHNLSNEQIAELLKLNPDEEPASASTQTLSDIEDDDLDYDQVIIESASESDEDESEPVSQSTVNEEPPVDVDLFNVDDSDLNRKVSEKDTSKPQPDPVSYEELKREWRRVIRQDCIRPASTIPDPSYEKYYRFRGRGSSGKIISWAYLDNLNVYAVKRERGIDYFRRFIELKTLPYFDFMQLCRLKLLYSERHDQAKWLQQRMAKEFRGKWELLRPQFPKIRFSKSMINPRTGKQLKKTIFKRAKIMRKVPLPKLKNNFHESFRWWYYDYRTTEAVIVIEKDNDWETIRVFDPMWLRNLTQDDIYALYKRPIFFAIEDMDQAMRFNKVVRVCFAFDIHAC